MGGPLAGLDRPWPADRCIHQLFEEQVARTPDAVALEFAGAQLSYREFNERANQVAHYLRKAGVARDSLVGVGLDRSFDALIAIYGVLKAGGAYVPLDPAYPKDRLTFMLEAAACKILVTTSRLSPQFGTLPGVRIIELDTEREALANENCDNPVPLATPDSRIYVIFTSGSTGRPKGAAVFHRGFTNLLNWFVTDFSIKSEDRTLLVSSLSFDLTQKNLYAPLISGGSLYLYPPGPYDVALLTRLIHQHAITLINCTPSAFYPLVERSDEAVFRQLASLRLVFLGGEPISVPRLRSWFTHPACRADVANTYGPTECTDICGAFRLRQADADRYSLVPLGRPIYNVQLVIVDPDLQPCPVGVAGELCVAGAGVGAGYINDPALTAEKFISNPFPETPGAKIYRTGDQARLSPDGEIEFLGRLDHQVKIRGFRIELHEIENTLNTHPLVREAIVIVKSPPLGSSDPRLLCYFTLKDGTVPETTGLKVFLRKHLPDYMVPSGFHMLPRFPLSPNGKVDRRALGQMPEPDPMPAPQLPASADQLESQILRLWQELLGRPTGLDDNFFDLGGNSIHVALLHTRLQELLGRQFPITDLFAHTTVRAIATHFSRSSASADENHALQERARRQRQALAARHNLRR